MLDFGTLTLDAGTSPMMYIRVDSRPHETGSDELLSSTHARAESFQDNFETSDKERRACRGSIICTTRKKMIKIH